jgi:hypothetical protein
MADPQASREALLRQEYHGQTARLPWAELERYFAAGRVIEVAPALDLVEVAVQLGLDNVARFEAWTCAAEVQPLSDSAAAALAAENAEVWAVVAAPWVLVQRLPGDAS